MEFPDLGEQCSDPTCKQLDFLPVKCDGCNKVFCKEHYSYTAHNCPNSYKKDNQVPVCPLCNKPVSVKKGQTADQVVGDHIDNDCDSDPAKQKRAKIFKNRCAKKGCKTKELIPFHCDKCRLNYCIKHRLVEDHECKGFQGSGRSISNAGAAALSRFSSGAGPSTRPAPAQGPSTSGNKPQQTPLSSIGRQLDQERQSRQVAQVPIGHFQAGLTEEQALAQALAMSAQEAEGAQQNSAPSRPLTQQEEEDLALARALQASEEEAARRRSQPTAQTSNKDRCIVH